MPFVPVPKDLTRVKTKVAFNLTQRQLICFGAGGLIGVPTYILTRGSIGNEAATLLMIGLMLPFFLFGIYEKDGQPLEKVLGHFIRAQFLAPKVRPYGSRIEGCLEGKRMLYERLVRQEITAEGYKTQKAVIDAELDRLRDIYSRLKTQTAQMRMDDQAKSVRAELAREAVGAGGLTAKLADALIDRVYVYPGNQVETVWKMKDFCMEGI